MILTSVETPVEAPKAQKEPAGKYERISLILSLIRTVACLGVFLAVAFVILSLGPTITNVLLEAEQAATTLTTIATEVQAADLPALINEVNQLVKQGDQAMAAATETMTGTFDAVQSLNIEELNEAISDFAAVVEPLSRLFGKK